MIDIKFVIFLVAIGLIVPIGCVVGQNGASASLTFTGDSNSFNPRDDIGVQYQAPASIRSSAWIGIVPSKISHGFEKECDTARARENLPYHRIKHKGGTMTFKAPQKPGSYDIRMFDSDHWGKEIASF
jgi:hypothetical protein